MADLFSPRMLLAGFILLLAILLIVLVVGNLRQVPPQVAVETVRSEADLAMRKINYTETVNGEPRWAVRADSASHDFEKNSAKISHVKVVVYDRERGDLEISAETGTFDLTSRVVVLSGDVVLNNVGGYSFFAEDLQFDGERQTLESSSPVRARSNGLELTAAGMRYDIGKRRFVLAGSVNATFSGAMSRP